MVARSQLSHYAKILNARAALRSVFLGAKLERAVVCNQASTVLSLSSEYSFALLYNTLQSIFLGAKHMRTEVYNQCFHYAKT